EGWATGGQLLADAKREASPEPRREPEDFDERPARYIGHPCAHAGLDGEEVRTVDPAQRLSKVIDAGRVQDARSVACHIHANLDDPDELHQVHDRLPKPVS